MASTQNEGFDPEVIKEYKDEMAAAGKPFLYNPEDEPSDEYVNVYFIGKHEGKEVIYDAALYTLRLHHESEVFDIAEQKAAEQFPEYKKLLNSVEEGEVVQLPEDQEEEVGLFMAEIIMELEEEGTIKVKEHIEIDTDAEFGISLDVALHLKEINESVIEDFIKKFNSGSLKLDETLYSFQTTEGEE